MMSFNDSALGEQAGRGERSKYMASACSHRLCLVPETCPFDCIAITAPNPRASRAYLDELVHRVGGRGTKEMLILAVSDPEGVRIGSGGGTLNAILEIDQALRQAHPPKSEDPQAGGLAAARVLLVHSGGDSQRSPTQCVCGKAWSALNSCSDRGNMCNTPMDLLLDHLSRLFQSGLAPGTLVVTACDVMLLIPPEVAATADWSFHESGGVAGLAIAADAAKYAPNHGVYCLDARAHGSGGGGEKNAIAGVRRYLQKPSLAVAEASGAFLPPNSSHKTSDHGPGNPAPEVAIDSGVVVFSGAATVALRGLAFSDTFKGCTARGVAGGAAALRLELYSDLLLALKTGTAQEDDGGLDAYLEACGPALHAEHDLSKARRETWAALRGFPLGGMLLTGATFVHLGTTPELMEMMTLRLPDFIEPYGLTARAASVVGNACSVEDHPPAVIVNSSIGGAGVVAGGAVVEHCHLQGDGWEIGAGSLISGVRSVKADYKLRLRSGMCLQQTDLGSEATEQAQTPEGKTFVVSLFGARDDIKAHYRAERARICGATWEAFLKYAGASAEDVWGGVAEADRKLWSARLFPVLKQEGRAAAADSVLWMQDVEKHTSSCSSSSSSSPLSSLKEVQSSPTDGAGLVGSSAEATKAWLAAERLSFKEILARADPCAEFKWRRHLEEGVEASQPLTKEVQGGGQVGGARLRAWDTVAIVTATMDGLHQTRRSADFSAGAASAFCVPPPRPTLPASATTRTSVRKEEMGGDGPLVLNAILVVVERYSALKRARFGSETSAAALRGMCVLLCLADGPEEEAEERGGTIQSGVPKEGGPIPEGGGVWVLQRDGSMFVIGEESIAPLLILCQSNPQYQCLTYLGADNAIPAPETPPPSHTAGAVATSSALDFMTVAAAAASASPPKPVPLVADAKRGQGRCHSAACGRPLAAVARREVPGVLGLKELDEKAADEACTPAAAAQALARIACRLYELADALGGGGHRSGPGEHPDWQEAMRGLDTLSPLPGGMGWGAPAALPRSVVALKSLRQSWLGVTGGTYYGNRSPTSPGNKGSKRVGADVLPFADAHLVVRCARHYERAAALVVSAAVMTASLFVEKPPARWEVAMNGVAAVGLSSLPGQVGQVEATAGEESKAAAAEGGDICSPSGGSSNADDRTGETLTYRSVPEQQQQQEQQHQQRRQLHQQQRMSSLTPRQQDMARHMQAHINHQNIIRENAQRTRERRQEEKERWEQQQQQEQQEQQEALPVGACVTSRAAARIDVAGGWTDTPPISYEAGGAVVNMAVTVSGDRPVEARCERIEATCVELVCEGRDGAVSTRTVCSSLQDFADFCVPQAPAALLKAALICAGIISLPSVPPSDETGSGTSSADMPAHASLQQQLGAVFGSGGIRITSRSGLPQGSGMGTSSILAGVVLSAACVAAGRSMSSKSLVHAVLRVEQLMTAGGGHQDQVGGLLGGVKICRTTANLPLQVLTEPIALDGAFEDALNDRLVLVFTGKQRLARDLLQGVVRGWHDRVPGTVNTVKGLVSNAEEAANACRGAGDLQTLGRCLSTYWEQKKRMAPGAEPPAVRALLEKLRPLCHGLSVCGAGGGGFIACITKSPGDEGIEEVTNALASSSAGSPEAATTATTITVHRGRLDSEGMEVSVDLPHP